MLGARKADALGPQLECEAGVGGVVGVGAHAHAAHLVGPGEDGAELAGRARTLERDGAEHHLTRGAVDGDDVARAQHKVAAGHGRLAPLPVDAQGIHPAHAGLSHATGDDGGVTRLAAVAREDALGRAHAGEVVGRGLPAHEHAGPSLRPRRHGVGCGEDDLAHGGAGARAQAARHHDALGVCGDLRVHELVELGGVHAQQRLLAGDEPLALHLHGDAQRRLGRALAHARLQEVEPALLDGELDVHHVAVVTLEDAEDLFELLAGLLQARGVAQPLDGTRVADAGHDVLALGVHEVVAVGLSLAGGGVAREGHARGGGGALVAKGHGLHVHGRAQVVGDVVLAAVEARPLAVPGAEDGGDGQAELGSGVLREGRHAFLVQKLRVCRGVGVLGEDPLEHGDEGAEGVRVEVRVGGGAGGLARLEDGTLEEVGVDAHDHVGEHLDEAAVGVPGKTRVFRLGGEPLDRRVIEAQVKHRVHHAGHGDGGTGAHGDEQGVVRVAQALADAALEVGAGLVDGLERAGGPGVAAAGVVHAGLAGDGEARRHREAQARHLGQVRALAAEDLVVTRRALRDVGPVLVGAEAPDAADAERRRVGDVLVAGGLPRWPVDAPEARVLPRRRGPEAGVARAPGRGHAAGLSHGLAH